MSYIYVCVYIWQKIFLSGEQAFQIIFSAVMWLVDGIFLEVP